MRKTPATGQFLPEREDDEEEEVKRVVDENAVVVVGRRGCCMVHVMRALLRSNGVFPKVCVVGEGAADEASAAAAPFVGGELTAKREDSDVGACILGKSGFPAVFIGGRLVGGLDRLMSVHISGELKPMLKQAGALWL